MMRLKHWWTPILGGMAIALGTLSAQAQPDPFNTPQPAGGGAITSNVRPISYAVPETPAMAQGIPSYDAVAGPGVQHADAASYMEPWPGVSLFEPRYQHLENNNGMWQYQQSNARRKYFTGVNFMFFQMQGPENRLFGDVSAHRRLNQYPSGATKDPDQDRDTVSVGSFFQGANPATPPNSIGKRVFNYPFQTEGIRVNWGYWDADDTGVEAVGWWASDVFYEFAIAEEIDITNPPPFAPRGPVIPARLPNGGAVTLFYDAGFRLRYRQSAANAQLTRLMRTIWEWGPLNVRPLWGGRYTLVREGIFFNGYDYSETVTEPFQTWLKSDTISHLGGPEVGLLGTLGGDGFKVTFGSRFILYVNHERQQLEGDGFINLYTRQIFRTADLRFHDNRISTHLSPAFEQTVHFEAKLFQYVPWLRRIEAFRNAKLRGGLTFLDIGLVARPANSIVFTAFPGSPRIRTERENFSLLAWDVGIQFEY